MFYLLNILYAFIYIVVFAFMVTPIVAIVYSTTDFLTATKIGIVLLYMLFGPLGIMFLLADCIGFSIKYSSFLVFTLYYISLLKVVSFFRTCSILKLSIGIKIGVVFLYILWAMFVSGLCGFAFDDPNSTANVVYVLTVVFYWTSLLVVPGILVFRALAV